MKRILVIGDACLDRFIYCDCKRLCPEGPVPVLTIAKQVENPGMAGNVLANVKAMYPNVDSLFNINFKDITKTRYVEEKSNHLFIRLDQNDYATPLSHKQLDSIRWDDYGCVIVSDYNKGFLSQDDLFLISTKHALTFIDTKKPFGEWIDGYTYIKINEKEYLDSKKFIDDHVREKTIVTLGERGCRLTWEVVPTNTVDVQDLSGAGDTFLAALAVKYFQTTNIKEAMRFANKCASIVVQKRGVNTI